MGAAVTGKGGPPRSPSLEPFGNCR